MNKIDRARMLIASLLLGLTLSATYSTVATAQQAPNPIKQSRTSAISERQIRAILNAMTAAAEQKDVDGIMKYMAPNITIKLTIRLGTGSQQRSLTREQYRQSLQRGFETAERRSGKYTNLKIQIAPNGQTATVAYTLVEEATLKRQLGTFVSTSQVTVKFERIKGQLLETAVMSDSTIALK
ncbi:MAG: nuclear transport factor 2 family protein [Stenomitos frigidus ULC029]